LARLRTEATIKGIIALVGKTKGTKVSSIVKVLPPLPTLGSLQQFLYGTLMSYCLRTHPPGLRDQTTPHSTSSPQSDLASYIILPGTGYISSLVNDNAASSVRTKTKG